MIDIHPAHHAATTWRDFFIHIATIVLGLLIAIGLEQTVEYFHHRHQASEARKNILHEMDANLGILQDDQKLLADAQLQLTRNLDLLDSGAPDAQILPQLGTEWNLYRRQDAAWTAAKIDGSLALISPSQIHSASYFYDGTEGLSPAVQNYFMDMDTIAAIVLHARTAGKLTPSARQQLLTLTASAMGRNRLISTIFGYQIRALQSNELQ